PAQALHQPIWSASACRRFSAASPLSSCCRLSTVGCPLPAGCPILRVFCEGWVLGSLLLVCGCPRFDFLPGPRVALASAPRSFIAVGYRLIASNSLSQSSHLLSSCCGLLTVG